jgi:histidinol-phosphate aminotransferase
VSPLVSRRDDLASLEGYHSPQVAADVRLNTNESPLPPPPAWPDAFASEIARVDANRYPDRDAVALRRALAELHGVEETEVFCANGSNEVLQCLLLAYGGPGRCVAVFEPTYALHSFIARLTGTPVVSGSRNERFEVEFDTAKALLAEHRPTITFLCSPNNPTGNSDPIELIERIVGVAPGLVVVDEAYGQFAPASATGLRGLPGADGLVVVRTFSKTWALAAARLGYLLGDAEVVSACEAVALPYHLSAYTQAAGLAALGFRAEMEERVALVSEERGRVAAALGGLAVDAWPSVANFILFRPTARPASAVWQGLLDRSVLVRDVSGRPELAGCLRVTIGTAAENDRFLGALEESLR